MTCNNRSFFCITASFVLAILYLALLFRGLPIGHRLRDVFLTFNNHAVGFRCLCVEALFRLRRLYRLVMFFNFNLTIVACPRSLVSFLFGFVCLLARLILLGDRHRTRLLLFRLALLRLRLLRPVFRFPRITLTTRRLLITRVRHSHDGPVNYRALLLLRFGCTCICLLRFLYRYVSEFRLNGLLLRLVSVDLDLRRVLRIILRFLVLLLDQRFLRRVHAGGAIRVIRRFRARCLVRRYGHLIQARARRNCRLFTVYRQAVGGLCHTFYFVHVMFFHRSLTPVTVRIGL